MKLELFKWVRSVNGYQIADGRFVRLKGKPVEYCPDVEALPPHIPFGQLGFDEVMSWDGEREPGSFADLQNQEVALKLVNQFGLLGINGEQDPESESISDFHKELCQVGAWIEDLIQQDGEERKISVNERLDVFNARKSIKLDAKLTLDSAFDRVSFHIVPHRLVDWIWYRFAAEMIADVKWRNCAYCEKYILVRQSKVPSGPKAHAGLLCELGRVYRMQTNFCSTDCGTRFNQDLPKSAKRTRRSKKS